jgi:hypothetical protein
VVVVVFGLLALLGWLNVRLASAEGEQGPATVLVFIGDRCYEVPASCLGLAPVTMAVVGHEAPATEAKLPDLQPLETPETEPPVGIAVLVPVPPPRSA